MAQNVTIAGASYTGVPSVNMPTTGGGTSSFYDVSDTTATASDVASGKVFYTASGAKATGTASGGSANIEALNVTQNGTYTASGGVDGYSPITVNVSGGGGGGGNITDPIRFFDYDGTLVASYSSVPAALPDNPSHNGLVAQGWNYTLAQIQTQFNASGTCDVGQMYTTESGDTEIDVLMQDGRLSPYLALAPNGTVTIDWGDGSATDTVAGTSNTTRKNTQHTYASAGFYTIKVHVSSGNVALYNTSSQPMLHANGGSTISNRMYSNCVQSVRIGASTKLGDYSLSNCQSLATVSIPSSVTRFGASMFLGCYSLAFVVVPSSVSSSSISNYLFDNCYSLVTVSIPSKVTRTGTYVFRNCYSLASIVLPSRVTTIGDYVFQNCYSLSSFTMPSGVTSLGTYVFQNCYSLASIEIPSGVTSIGTSAFNYCNSLASITIPSGVSSIGNNAFNACGFGEIHFTRETPPTLTNSNAFLSVPTDCIIYVPSGSLSAYTSASYYPSSSTYAYVEE